jgi:hypothetical protein
MAGGSGVQQLTYQARGAQPIASTATTSLPVNVPITATGPTILTYGATDKAGNQGPAGSETIFVAALDQSGQPFACAAPTPAFQIPRHGTLIVTGTVTVNGHTSSFTKTVEL